MRIYFKLLRMPYQLQLAPIFAWGFLLGGGRFGAPHEIARFFAAFSLFHIGAFGGMTALNSFYDRDETPIGGMWAPPKIPRGLWHFAWLIQLLGLVLLIPLGAKLSLIYLALLILSWLYSHPIPRGKGHPWKSLLIVSIGQGVLDCLAGAFTASSTRFDAAFWLGCAGATITVAAFFPLTQLYQTEEDAARDDKTLALWLMKSGGRNRVFAWSQIGSCCGTIFNAGALWRFGWHMDAALFLVLGMAPLWFLENWKSSTRKLENTARTDFVRVHFLMRAMALLFGAYVVWRLSFRS